MAVHISNIAAAPVREYEKGREGPHIGTRRNTSYIWLAYSVFFFLDPIFSHNRRVWILSGMIYAVFLALYLTYMYVGDVRVRRAVIAGLYGLGLATFPTNGGATCFFIYSAALLPFAISSTRVVAFILTGQAIGVFVAGMLFHIHPLQLVMTIVFTAVVGSSNVFIAIQKRADYKLRLAQSEIEQLAAVAERERIARDLHDVLGHTLSLIVLKAELAGRLIERDPERAAQEMGEVERTARNALAEVRETIGGYRARGLPSELVQARDTLEAAGVSLVVETPIPQLAATEETVLCLAVREAVTNIVRHARATQCSVRFAGTRDGRQTLVISDDGAEAVIREGNGLRGMRERVQSLGGRLSLSSGPGLTLCIDLPRTEGGSTLPSSCAGVR